MNNTYNVLIEDVENALNGVLDVHFDDVIDSIKTKGNIVADLKVSNLGEFVKVTGQASGVAVLECDLCLEEFDYEFDIDIDELFAKDALLEDYGQEFELKEGQFVTDLKGSKDIDLSDLLYQSVILDFPNKKVCGINCKGGDIFIRDEEEDSAEKESDPRLAVFKNIVIK